MGEREKGEGGAGERGRFHAGNVQNMLYISCCFTVSPLSHAHPHLCMCPPMCSLSLSLSSNDPPFHPSHVPFGEATTFPLSTLFDAFALPPLPTLITLQLPFTFFFCLFSILHLCKHGSISIYTLRMNKTTTLLSNLSLSLSLSIDNP